MATRSEGRRPKDERGWVRVNAILDAASALIAEKGIAALTVDAVAQKSSTSKSSMYHFFPDLDAILTALAERHSTNLSENIVAKPEGDPDWSAMTIEAAVESYLKPVRTYVCNNPDVMPVVRACQKLEERQGGCEGFENAEIARAERLVKAFLPELKPAARRARAATIFAMIVGVVEQSSTMAPPLRNAMLKELHPVLVSYLGAGRR